MKKQESGKKGLKWILLVLALVILAAAAVTVVLLTGGGGETQQTQPTTEPAAQGQTIKIGWNVDRDEYAAKGSHGASGRYPRSDGYYYIRYAIDGEQVDLPVADRSLVDQLDTMDYTALVVDPSGTVVDFLTLEEYTGGLAADGYYVEAINGNTYTVNTSGTYKGVSVDIEIPETAKIYNVGGEGLLVGLPGKIALDDQIIALKNFDGEVFLVYVIPYEEPGDVYWNMNRQYDSTTGMTTREPSVTGWYEFEMAFGGEIVTLRTRDMNVASAVDKSPAKCTGLTFDEEGNISGTVSASATAGGTVIGSWYHIVEINGNTLSMEKFSGSEKGNTCEGILSDHTRIVNVSTVGTPGEYLKPEDLRVGDQVHCLTDVRTKLAYVFVIGRLSETAKLCWNVDRQYDSTLKTTKRLPAADGYYYITLACEGEQFTARTKDVALINAIDSNGAKCSGIELEGDVIVKVGKPSLITGGGVVASWYDIISISEDGRVVTARKNQKGHAEDGNVVEVILDDNTDIFDVSANVTTNRSAIGQRTTLQVGDRIHGLTGLKKTAHTVFVVSRPRDLPVGWNMTRKYDSNTKQTTRERAADGYFYYDIAIDGKVRTLKVASLDVANHIDSNAAKCRGLKIVGDVITESVATSAVRGTNGAVEASWAHITSVNKYYATAEKRDGAQAGEKYTITYAWNCKVYNVSGLYDSHPGEATTLRLGDQVHCLRDVEGNTTYIFVVNRVIDGVVGWNVERKYDSASKGTARTPDANGWYYFTFAYDGTQKVLKTQDKKIADAVDATSTKICGLALKGDVITRVVVPSKVRGYEGGSQATSVVNGITSGSVSVVNPQDGKVKEYPLAYNCGIYNVSNQVTGFVGEKTSLKYGATVNVVLNSKQQAVRIFMSAPGVTDVTTGYCNVCKKNVTWVKHKDQQPIIPFVHTWLDSDAVMDYMTVTAGGTYTLFLNGHTLTYNNRAFKLNSKTVLNIYDSKADGSDIGGKLIGKGVDETTAKEESNGRSESGVIVLWGENTLNLYSGTVAYEKGELSVSNGGVVGGNGTFNMYGGTLTGGVVTGSGAQVRMFNGVFNMYGGTVEEGTAGGNGSSIMADGNNESRCGLNLLGGSVKGNAYATAVTPVSVGGNIQVKDLFLTKDKLLKVAKTLTADAKIGISMAVPGVFLKNTKDQTGVFTSNAYIVAYDAAARTMALKFDHEHCTCGGSYDHAHESVGWARWDGKTAMKAGGNYYLTEDVTIDTWINLNGGKTSLCLNGHTLESKGRVFKLMGNATLNITDCGEGGKILGHGITEEEATAEQKGTSEGGTIMIWSTNTLNLYAGELAYTPGEKAVLNGAVVAGNGTFNMYGGAITGGEVTNNGGNVRMYNGSFNLYAGSVTGGNAVRGADVSVGGERGVCNIQGGTAGRIFLETGASMQVGGDVQITEVYLNTNQMLSITQPLAETASIGLTMATPGVFAMEVAEDYTDRFDAKHQVVYDEQAKTLSLYIPPHIHCVCGGNGAGAAEHSCGDITWQPWLSATDLPTQSGNYYLTEDVQTGMLKVEADDIITICLNGHTVSSGTVRNFNIYGKLVITDCAETQGVITNENSALAPVFYVFAAGQFDLYGGTLKPGKSVSQAGIGAVSHDMATMPDAPAGVMNIYGGTLKGGSTTTGSGGGISLWNKATLNIYGGTITECSSSQNAGALNIGTDCTLNIYGGTITGNKAVNGGGVLMGASAIVNLYGGTVTGNTATDGTTPNNIHITSKLPTVGTLAQDASFGITMANPGVFAQSTSDYSTQFSSDHEDYKVVFEDGKLSLESKIPPHKHCLCNGDPVGNHTACTEITWQPWTSENSLPTQSGNYYLTADVQLASMAVIQNKKDVKLCLNGHTVTSQQRVYKLFQNTSNPASTLSVTDCVGTGIMEGKGMTAETSEQKSNEGTVLMNWGSGTVNLYGGTYRMAQGHNAMNNGGIFTGNGTLNMYGGTITGGQSKSTGGNIRLYNGTLNMYGGTITGGNCANSGSNISIGGANSALRLLGGTVSGGTQGLSGISIDTVSTIYVGGSVKAEALRLANNQKLSIQAPLTNTEAISIMMDKPGVFMDNVATDLSAHFTTTDRNYAVKYDSSAKTLALAEAHTGHCLCADQAKGLGDHTACTNLTWTAWTSNNSLPTASGNYYLTKDVELSTFTVLNGNNMGGNKTLNLCLNGYTVTSESRVYRLHNSVVLNITDCCETGEMVGKGLTDAEITAEGNGGVSEGGVVLQWNSNTTFRLYAGTLRLASVEEGGRSNIKNGGVFHGAGTFAMYGGTMKDGRVTEGGGNMRMFGGKMNIYGGSIENGAATNGGNIAAAGSVVANISGVTLKNGSAVYKDNQSNGGNFYVAGGSGSATLTNVTFEGGIACRGGHVAAYGTATIQDCTVSGGNATYDGANMFTYNAGNLTLENVTVEGVAKDCSVPSVGIYGNTLTLKGKVVIRGADRNLRIATGKQINASALAQGSEIWVELGNVSDKFATVSDSAAQAYFFPDDTTYVVVYNTDKTLSLTKK